MEKIQFSTNVPVEIALKFTDGKQCESQFGPPQWMFTTTDDRVFFVAEKVAQKIHGLRLAPGELFDICKAEVPYGNGRKGIEWQVSKVGEVPKSPAGAVPPAPTAAAPNGTAGVSASVNGSSQSNGNGSDGAKNGNGNNHGNGHAAALPAPEGDPLQGWALFLLSQTKQLIDVFALASEYASRKHGNAVKPEDVRSLMLSAFINVSKNGGVNVA